MNIGLSINKLKELTGGGASGISSWEEWGSVTGKNPITLPTKFTEIKVVTTIDTYSFTKTITYDEIVSKPTQTLYDSNFSATSHASNRSISWSISGGKIQMAYVYHNGSEISTSVVPNYTTTLYYKRSYENVVNVGTVSNWELLGSVTGSNEISLPTEWEEIRIVTLRTGSEYLQFTYTLTNDEYNILLSNGGLDYFKLSPGSHHDGGVHYCTWLCYQNKIRLGSLYANSTDNMSKGVTYIYYKKKCDNVLDINDLSEWKLFGAIENTSLDVSNLISMDFKEVLIEVQAKSSYKCVSSLIIPKERFLYFLQNGTSSSPYLHQIGYDDVTTCRLKLYGTTIGKNETYMNFTVYYR